MIAKLKGHKVMHNKTKTNTEHQQTMGSTLKKDKQQQNTALEQTAA